jgi:leucyl aminopeptidase
MIARYLTNLTCFSDKAAGAIPLYLAPLSGHAAWLASLPKASRDWLSPLLVDAKAGQCFRFPHGTDQAVVAIYSEETLFDIAAAIAGLPARTYAPADTMAEELWPLLIAAWGMHHYKFLPLKTKTDGAKKCVLVLPKEKTRDYAAVLHYLHAVYLVRDLINLPASHLGTDELAAAAKTIFEPMGAAVTITRGSALESGYPAIHAVGKGSDRPPALVEINWGKADHPRVSVVGKGIVFDTGGYDIKPSSAMALMKKDMGGAAHAIGLGYLIINSRLPVRLQILLPLAENSISGRAMRPSDVIATRKGLSVEVGDTDAEGRLVLADALARADETDPDVVIDFATLTGAARVALGPDLPALFSTDNDVARDVANMGYHAADPVWPLPLWAGYADDLKGKVADLNSIGKNGFAGAIYAALFMQNFLSKGRLWLHLDTYAWNAGNRPGRPEGGEALGLRAIYAWLRGRYGA